MMEMFWFVDIHTPSIYIQLRCMILVRIFHVNCPCGLQIQIPIPLRYGALVDFCLWWVRCTVNAGNEYERMVNSY